MMRKGRIPLLYFHLDAREATSREALHTLLKHGLCFPAYYGENLDALFDLLREPRGPITLDIVHADALNAHLGDFAQRFLSTLADAHEENPDFSYSLRA